MPPFPSASPHANSKRLRTLISAVLAFLLLLGLAPFMAAKPPAAEADEGAFLPVVVHFKDAAGETVDFAEYAAPVTRAENGLMVSVNPPDGLIDYADHLKFGVYTHFAAFQNQQVDITPECTFHPESGVVTIPATYESELSNAAIVFWLSPSHPAYDTLVASQFDAADITLTLKGDTMRLSSNISAIKAQASATSASQAAELLSDSFPNVDKTTFKLNPRTRLEEFGIKQVLKKDAYGFPESWRKSYSFGTFFGTTREFDKGLSLETDWNATVLDPEEAAQYPVLEDYLASTIAARLGDQAPFAMTRRESEPYGERCVTRGGTFQDAGFISMEAPVGMAFARGTCGSSDINNGGGTPQPQYGGDNYIAYKGIYRQEESPYDGWNAFYYKFDTESGWTGDVFQDITGYLLVPPFPGGKAQLTKVSTDLAISTANSNYSLENGVFAAFKDEEKARWARDLAQEKPWVNASAAQGWAKQEADLCFVTNSSGTSALVENIAPGQYYVVELLAPKGFRLSSAIVPFTVHTAESDGDISAVTFRDDPQFGAIDLLKQSSNPSLTAHNAAYSLQNATYGVFTDASCLNCYRSLSTSLNAASEGYGRIDRVPIGKYWVKETGQPDKGFALDPRIYPITVTDTAVVRVNGRAVIEKAKLCPLGILLTKKDAQSQEAFAQGTASLGDAHFQINYYDVENGTEASVSELIPRASWVVRTNDEGSFLLNCADGSFIHRQPDGAEQELPYKVSGDEFYRLSDGRFALPLGTYTLKEVKAPEGYLLDSTIHVRHIKDAGGTDEILDTFQAEQGGDMLTNQVVRADISFQKRADGAAKLAGIPFKLTSKTTGEWHVVVTDKNGRGSTASTAGHPHTTNTNGNDSQFKAEDGSFTMPLAIDEAALDASAGIWFGLNAQGDSVAVDNALGALPFDTYELEELRCPTNALFQMIRDEITVDTADAGTIIDLGTLNNHEERRLEADIFTVAVDKTSGLHEGVASEKTVIVDTVFFENLTPGITYRLRAVLMDRATGKPFLKDGTIVTAEKTFTPLRTADSTEMELDISGADLDGATLVVFESLMLDGVEIALHADLDDERQTVRYRNPEPNPEPNLEPDPEPDPVPDPEPQDELTLPFTGGPAPLVRHLAKTGDYAAMLLGAMGAVALGSFLVFGGTVLVIRRLRKGR